MMMNFHLVADAVMHFICEGGIHRQHGRSSQQNGKDDFFHNMSTFIVKYEMLPTQHYGLI